MKTKLFFIALFVVFSFCQKTSAQCNPLIDSTTVIIMNDTTFTFGGITDENPILLAFVKDSSGINTTGNGIGHDIVAVYDGNTEKSVVLNDYYESDLDSYQSGTIKYPFYNLLKGRHSLTLKVWDVYNNSAEAYTEFVVFSSGDVILENLQNYPNPFIDHTNFIFQHNQPGETLQAEIQIFNISGQLVKTINQEIFSDGYNAGPITWNGSSDYGDRIGRGLYVYKIRITNSLGKSFEKTSKLIVLK